MSNPTDTRTTPIEPWDDFGGWLTFVVLFLGTIFGLIGLGLFVATVLRRVFT
jgi:hypothetical protein